MSELFTEGRRRRRRGAVGEEESQLRLRSQKGFIKTHRLSSLVDAELDALTMPRRENPLDGVGEGLLAVGDADVGEESLEPSELGSSEGVEPLARGRKDAVDGVDVLLSTLRQRLDGVGDVVLGEEGRGVDHFRGGGEVIDGRDGRGVVVVELLEELVGERRLDATEHRGDGLLGRLAVLDGDGSLEDADTLSVLVEDGLDVLRLPERVLLERERRVSEGVRVGSERTANLFEPDAERSVENGDEGNGLRRGRGRSKVSSSLSSSANNLASKLTFCPGR